ncbi:MAG TPA: DUF3047 domain-containing protein [Burkholderiales bacterium]|nr:DUF3047 domain-containing protein [Burkholderiales bacterium]
MKRGWGITAVFAAALVSGCASLRDSVTLPYVASFSDGVPGTELPAGWEPWALSKFKKSTQYQLVAQDGKTVIKASARASASGLVHRLDVDPKQFPMLEWHWKVTELIAAADNTKKHAEDSPVRVVVSFDGDIARLPLGDRLFFDNMRALSGRQMPYATLMYIWENRAVKDTVIPNLHTTRVKMIVAESGRGKLGEWQEVVRNVYEDYRRAFGEEPGNITMIGIMTDTDNTGANVHAYYGDIVFRRIAPPRRVFASD